MTIFNLPDLGEGLPDAEIIKWHVNVGDDIKLDAALVSMETAKAVVELPSPFSGKIAKLYGQAGDVIETGQPLVDFTLDDKSGTSPQNEPPRETGTVVGKMETSDKVVNESMTTVDGVRVTPAVRAIAHKLKVNLSTVVPSGRNGVVTRTDVEDAAKNPQTPVTSSRLKPESATPVATSSWPIPHSGDSESVGGPRRTMARVMSESHAQVVPTSIMDDADIHLWNKGQDMTVRLLRSLWAGAQAEPGLNAWYDAARNMRLIHQGMDVGMAVDTPDGLFAATLHNVHTDSASAIRDSLNRLIHHVENRSIPPDDLKGYTIMLSNFGKFAGRYATPVITPPCVSIIAAGRARNAVVATRNGYAATHRIIPLSLTFDHRACTGGEAARFLAAMMDDLELAE